MKKLFFFAALLVAFTGTALTNSFTTVPDQACGVIALGKFKLDLSGSEATIGIPKAVVVESIKSGLTFTGTSNCPGTYEIVDLHLTIEAAREAKYEYNHDFVVNMKSMEDYMLVRYFNDALKLTFKNIKVKDSAGKILEIPSVSFVVQ